MFEPYVSIVDDESPQNFPTLMHPTHRYRSLYSLSMHYVTHVTSDTRPSRFSVCNIESWEGPGDKASILNIALRCKMVYNHQCIVMFNQNGQYLERYVHGQ